MMKKSKYFSLKKKLATLMVAIIASSSFTVSAADNTAYAKCNDDGSVTFSNLDSLDINESIECEMTDTNGNLVVVSIERLPNLIRSSARGWKVSYNSGVINASFHMTVDNNKVSSVYDDRIITVGCLFSDDALTKTSTYGKLTFNVTDYFGILKGKCWLRGTVTGSDNDINVDWQM